MMGWVGLALIALIGCDDGAGGDAGPRGDGAVVRDGGGADADAGPRVDGGDRDAGTTPIATGWAPQPWEDCEGGGRTLEAGPSDYRDVLDTLMPGDTLRLGPGDYTRGLTITVSGEEGRCIVIEARDPSARPRLLGSDAFNIVAIHGASWVKVRNLDIDGLGMDGFGVASQGGDAMPTHHVVIEGMDMVGLGGDQQIVGVSTKSPAWDWVIRGNRIVGAGTGMYLGNSDGSQPFVRGVVELNTILDTIGYCAQIKHQNPRPTTLGMPADGARTIIRWNVFSKGSGSSTTDARPNLLIGHLPLSGDGVNDLYVIYGNFFYDNPTENLLQAEGNLAIFANAFVNPNGGALRIAPHNDVPRRVDVFLNTIVSASTALTITGGDSGFAQRSRYNAIFGGSVAAGDSVGDVTGDLAAAVGALVDPSGAPTGPLDLHPSDGSLGATIDDAELPSDVPERARDFDGRMRDRAFAGAYEGPADASAVPLTLSARSYGP